MLYRGKETIGRFDTDREAMEAAREQEMQDGRQGRARPGGARQGFQ
jgi:hypothetical protein